MIPEKDHIALPSARNRTSLIDEKLKGLDEGWIVDLLRRRSSNYSTVLLLESSDPLRWKQLEGYIVRESGHEKASCYLFDLWNGLRLYSREDGKWHPIEVQPPSGGYERLADLRRRLVDLDESLRYVDGILKGERAVFVLQWMDAPRESDRNPRLSYALRGWAFDPFLLANDSTVIVIASDISTVVDSATSELLAFKRTPLAEQSEREHLIRYCAHRQDVQLEDSRLWQLALGTAGLNLHQLESVLLEAYEQQAGFSPECVKRLKAELITRSELVEIQEPDPRGFGAVGGYSAVKRFVRDKVIEVLSRHDLAELHGVPLPRGVLLFGPPGTGKTVFAKALAREVNLPFIRMRTEKLYSRWLGESGRRFGEAIRLVEQMSPALVFIDEIDRFGKRTSASDSASQETGRVFSQVLEWLGDDQRRSIIVGTTNIPDQLDDAFLREGRFDYKIPLLYPPHEARKEILRIHLGLTGLKPKVRWNLTNEEENALLDEIAEQTKLFTGAELEQLCVRARRNALNRGRETFVKDDLVLACQSFRIDLERRAESRSDYMAMCRKHTNDDVFLVELEKEL